MSVLDAHPRVFELRLGQQVECEVDAGRPAVRTLGRVEHAADDEGVAGGLDVVRGVDCRGDLERVRVELGHG